MNNFVAVEVHHGDCKSEDDFGAECSGPDVSTAALSDTGEELREGFVWEEFHVDCLGAWVCSIIKANAWV